MIKLIRRTGVVLGGAALAIAALAAPVGAHVVATPNTAESTRFHTAMRVGHGCAGSPTTAVRIQIPKGVYHVDPVAVPGWEVEVTRSGGHHGRVVEVAWVGGPLPDAAVQLFGLGFTISRWAPEVLWFPTVQQCEVGENRWVEIPPSVEEWSSVPHPAPYVINATR